MLNKKIVLVSVLVISLFMVAEQASALSFNWWAKDAPTIKPATTTPVVAPVVAKPVVYRPVSKIKKFTSAADFKSYLKKAEKLSDGYGFGGGPMMMERSVSSAPSGDAKMAAPTAAAEISPSDRFSSTNVQVVGIDEPDLVKIDSAGEIYFSGGERYRSTCYPVDMALPGQSSMMKIAPCRDDNYGPRTALIKGSPVSDLRVESIIDDAGQLLLSRQTLVMQTGNSLTGYNIADKKNPSKKWSIDLSTKDNRRYTRIVDSRLVGEKIYLVTASNVHSQLPCPYELFKVGSRSVNITCGEVYHPTTVIPANSIYTVSVIDPATGAVEKKTSLLTQDGNAVVYVSPKNIYIAYGYNSDEIDFAIRFFREKARGILPSSLMSRIEKLSSLDISRGAKNAELYELLNQYYQSIDSDDQVAVQSNLQNRLADYVKIHLRELETTEIAKINLASLQPVAGGTVPGRLLNQFSMDEYRGYLRVATTNNGGVWLPGNLSANNQSESDVYVLGNNLNQVGVVRGLGQTERIFGVRFIGDKGYVVTFRQIDPFYVLDLSRPTQPKLVGELKIPGYSGYLHPIDDNRIIGVGQENNKVKVALFDVSDPKNPRELSRFLLNDGYSEAINNHRAFLIDSKYQVFFLPGSQGGYVFSYAGNQLQLEKAVGDYTVRRAVYFGNTLYIIGDTKLTALDERTWEKVKEITYNVGWNSPVIMY